MACSRSPQTTIAGFPLRPWPRINARGQGIGPLVKLVTRTEPRISQNITSPRRTRGERYGPWSNLMRSLSFIMLRQVYSWGGWRVHVLSAPFGSDSESRIDTILAQSFAKLRQVRQCCMWEQILAFHLLLRWSATWSAIISRISVQFLVFITVLLTHRNLSSSIDRCTNRENFPGFLFFRTGR